MRSILYFLVTDKAAAAPADLEAVGLAHALSDHGTASVRVRGPENLEGLLIAANGAAGETPALVYQSEKQAWRKGPGGKYFVGVDRAAMPGPDDLARAKIYPGQAVKLLDGNEWIVPRCVGMLDDRPMTLPRQLDLADDGETAIARPHPRYEALCARAFDWWLQWSRQSETKKLTTGEQLDLAIAALAVNYRIGKLEAVSLLGLFGTDEFGLVLRAMIDADEVDAFFAAQEAAELEASSGASEKKPAAT
jgi:hypothetical protein